MKKLKLFTLLAGLMFSVGMWANPTSGNCGAAGIDGDNLQWEITGESPNYTLTITGSGAMEDFTLPPWQEYAVNIKTVILPDGITHLGAMAFHATNITNLVVPNSVVSIGTGCFSLASSMETITLSDHLETIGSMVFDCSGLTSLTIPASVTSIGFGLTAACASLAELSVETGNTVYESPAESNAIVTKSGTITLVAGCKSTVIPSNVTVIGAYAMQTTTIPSISIPNGVTTIQDRAFSDCWLVKSLSIPASVTQIASNAFIDTRFNSITVDADNPKYDSRNNCNAIIETATNKLVVGCAKTQIPNNVTTIAENAFFESNIASLVLPANVQTIEYYAFAMCSQLLEIICGSATPPSLNAKAFGEKDESSTSYHETSRNIPVYVPVGALATYQAADGWKEFTNFKEITARPSDQEQGGDQEPAPDPCQDTEGYRGKCGESLNWVLACKNNYTYDLKMVITGYGPMYDYSYYTELPWWGKGAFITSLTLPNGMTTISPHTFAGVWMTEVNLPASVTTIGYGAFANCFTLKTINFPSNSHLQSIGFLAFDNCPELTSLHIPASLTNIGYGLTSSCVKLTQITVDEANTVYDSRNNCNAIIRKSDNALVAGCKSTIIPNGVTKIGKNAFSSINFEAPLVIPESVKEIEEHALSNTKDDNGMTSITLPAGVTTLGEYALGIKSLASMTCKAVVPPAAVITTFNNVDKSIPLYVPAASVTAYKAANVWKEFTNIQPIPEEVPDPCENTSAYHGTCGENLNWVLTCEGELVITGIGAMNDYSTSSKAPWDSKRFDITSIVLPNGLTHIGEYAFYNLSGVTSITLPSTLTSIGKYAFFGCSIASVTIPSSMTTISEGAFNGATKLTSVTIPNSVTAIGKDAFSGCKLLASVTIPDAVTSIGEGAFMLCSALTYITIPAAVTEIGLSAFSGCTSLAVVNCLPTTAPTLGHNAFYNHPEDFVIYYYGSDQDYANKFLQYWDYLRNASTSAAPSVTPHLTGSCGSLTWDLSFTGSGSLLEHDGKLAFSGTGDMADYNWLNNEWAPWQDYAEFINHIEIEDGVTKIGESAFANLEHVNTFVIPASVTYIGGDAFMGCNNPEMIVYCYANPANLEWHDNVSAYEGEGLVPDDFLTLTRNAWGNYEWHVQATKCVVPSNYLEGYKAKWARGGDYKWWDLNVWFTSELQDGESAEYINNALNDLDGKTAPVVSLVRPLNRDGYFATLCLPFDMSAAQIAESSLHGAEIKEFVNAAVVGGSLELTFSPVSEIKAGQPYFIKYADAELLGDALDRLDFMAVTIDKTAPQQVKHGEVTMIGTYVPVEFPAQTGYSGPDDILFLKSENKLAWPKKEGTLKPFRCYFKVNTLGGGSLAPKRGMPARIVEVQKVPTAIENAAIDGKYNKMIQDGQLIVIKNGVKYNAQGQIVK